MSEHEAALVAIGLTLALVVGVYGEKLMQAYRDVWALQARLRNAKGAMRAARLVFVLVLVLIFAIAWPYLHGFG